jgi:ABC-type amino acid transport substrate-binding protein
MRRLILALALMATACSDFPRDPEATLERVRASGAVRVGLIAAPQRRAQERDFLARLAEATGARPVFELGSTESLLTGLEEGRLDLVVGEISSDSPWATRATFIPPLDPGQEGMVLTAAARNGENGWITLVTSHAHVLGRSE